MSEVITIPFPDISGETGVYTAFLRGENGPLLNPSGDTITEKLSSSVLTGIWEFTLDEDRVANRNYLIRVYEGTSETAENLVYDDILYSGQLQAGKQFQALSATMIRATVGSSPSPTVSSLPTSFVSTTPSVVDQWKRRVIIFNNSTTTVALRGQAAEILGSSADSLPLLTCTDLKAVPVSGDAFVIV